MIDLLYTLFLRHPVVVTDSRKIVPGCLFFALQGDQFDGNAFAAQALKDGAAYAVIDHPAFKTGEQTILVDNALIALQQLATCHRRQLNIPFLAITGSNGKTTTKELTAAVLSTKYKTRATRGNLNNHIGVPLTLLSIPQDAEMAVIEMGANHQCEIDFLCRIAEPTHGLITNIGKAHLEGFGGLEGVKKGKSEMYRYLAAHDGTIFVNRDEAFLSELAEQAGAARQIGYRRSDVSGLAGPDIEIRLIKERPFLRIGFLDADAAAQETPTQLIGAYNFANAMTAIAVGKYFNVPAARIKNALAEYVPSDNRSQIIAMGESTIILDAYNANPSSMRAALLHFAKTDYPSKIVILGDMFELGEAAAAEHRAICDLAQSLRFDQLILVGKNFSALNTGNLRFKDAAEAKVWFQAQSFGAAGILLKGSRGMQLEALLHKSKPVRH